VTGADKQRANQENGLLAHPRALVEALLVSLQSLSHEKPTMTAR
jgi:hypothetical protein